MQIKYLYFGKLSSNPTLVEPTDQFLYLLKVKKKKFSNPFTSDMNSAKFH